MPIHQWKNTINNTHGNMATPENRYPTTTRLKYLNKADVQGNDLKIKFKKILRSLK